MPPAALTTSPAAGRWAGLRGRVREGTPWGDTRTRPELPRGGWPLRRAPAAGPPTSPWTPPPALAGEDHRFGWGRGHPAPTRFQTGRSGRAPVPAA